MEIILNPLAIKIYLTILQKPMEIMIKKIYYHENYNYLSHVILFIPLTFKAQDRQYLAQFYQKPNTTWQYFESTISFGKHYHKILKVQD